MGSGCCGGIGLPPFSSKAKIAEKKKKAKMIPKSGVRALRIPATMGSYFIHSLYTESPKLADFSDCISLHLFQYEKGGYLFYIYHSFFNILVTFYFLSLTFFSVK